MRVYRRITSSTSPETIKTYDLATPFGQREVYFNGVIVLVGQSHCLETECSTCHTLSLCTVSSLEYRRKAKEKRRIHECVSYWRYDVLSMSFYNEGILYLSKSLSEFSPVRSKSQQILFRRCRCRHAELKKRTMVMRYMCFTSNDTC